MSTIDDHAEDDMSGDVELPTDAAADTRAGFIAVVGATNAGKSTFVNRCVGTKVSIVSHKVQTTRSRILGLCMSGTSQVIFVDTPGLFQPKRRLDRAMIAAAWGGAVDADMILLLIDTVRGVDAACEATIAKIADLRRPAFVALNKIDLVDRKALLALIERVNSLYAFEETFLISALNGDGIDDVVTSLAEKLPKGPYLYPEDQVSDMPMRLLAAEITREQIFAHLHQELPYAITVETEDWKELKDGSARVEQTVYVERDSQRSIVLGKAGSQIKTIGATARVTLEDILERRVHLFVFVKVRPKWGDDPARYREWGLDFNA